MDSVEKFIEKFKFKYKQELEYIFSYGNCYYFAVILKERFNGEIYYLPITNHFICKIDKNYYDITGKAKFNEPVIKWSTYIEEEPKDAKRIIRDCIEFGTRK